MYRRDLLTAEIQRLTEVLAKIMGLKLAGQQQEAENLLQQLLQKEYNFPSAGLLDGSEDAFAEFLEQQDFPADKLDVLSQLLYAGFDPASADAANISLAEKLQMIYHLLETRHHVIHLVNLDRQKHIQHYLKLQP